MGASGKIFFIVFILFWIHPIFGQELPVSSFQPLTSKSYGIAEGLPDRCVEYAFIDKLGKLNLIPCQHAQISYGQHLYQMDGHTPFLDDIVMDHIDPNLIIQSLGMIGDSINFGRMIKPGGEYEGQWVSSYFYSFWPETGAFSYFELVSDAGFSISINNVIYDSGRLIGCGTYGEKAYVFEILDERISLLNQVDLKASIETERIPRPFVKFKNQYLWMIGETIYEFSMLGNQNPRKYKSGFIIRPNELNYFANHDNTQLFLYASPGRVYVLNQDSGTFSPWFPDFLSFIPRQSYLFQDNQGNILFSFHKDENEYASYLLDRSGRWHDYTEVIRHLSPIPGHFTEHALVSADFTKYLFQTLYDFDIVEVRSSTSITAIPSIALRGMVELEPGKIFASGNRIFSENESDWNLSSFSTCPIINHVRDVEIFKDEEGMIWENGVHYIIKHNETICDTIDYKNRLVRMVPKGRNHFLVLDSEGELLLFDKKTFQFDYIATSIGDELNMQMLLDNENTCWLVANTIVQFIDLDDPASGFIKIEHSELDKDFISIDKDTEGRVWLGTFSNGLYIYDLSSNELTNINESNGLSNNSVATMLQDGEGDHWIGTFNGITVIDRHLNILGQIYKEDGLVHNECNRWSTIKLSNGDLGFGTVAGLSIIDPIQVKKDISHKPSNRIYLSRVTLPTNQIVQGSAFLGDLIVNGIQLPANNRNIKISYGLSQYTQPEKTKYAYRFKGLQEEWNYVGGLHDLHLLDLPQGQYNLEIKAWDYRGIPSENTLIIPLEVSYFFYQQVWFYLLSAVFFGFLLYLWYQSQQRIQRRLEAEVQNRTATIRGQAEKLKEMDDIKTRLYTNITHEFRTPLTIIKGLSDQMEQDPRAPELIKRNTDNLLTLVNQMLDLRKLESGNLKLELKQIDIIQFLNYICESFQSLAQVQGKQFHFLHTEEEIWMDLDQGKLAQIINNLFSNALKFTSEGDHIYVLVDRIGEDDLVKIRIKDTGIGIPEEKLARVFDRFYQVDDSMTRQGEGTGIGLTLVSEYVKLMNGEIEVKSKLGQETTFQITLPITRNAPLHENFTTDHLLAPMTSSPTSPNYFNQNDEEKHVVLIVEDNPDVIHYLGNILKDKFKLLIASNGQDGVDRALHEVPDLIISDVMMPIKDGYELCEILKTDMRTSHVPIILLTAKADIDSRLIGLERGADAYLPKPFHQKELLVRVDALIKLRLKLQSRYNQVKTPTPTADPDLKLEDQFINSLHKFLSDNLSDENYDIQQICEDMRVSRSQLHKKLKALTGMSTSHYVRSYKLIAAEQLLLNPQYNVSEVAYQVGFKSPKYFTRLFKEKNGLSPTEWIVAQTRNGM